MKIAHVVPTFPPDIGGMGQVAFDEAKELAARGHDVTVFTIAFPEQKYDDEKLPFKVVREKTFLRTASAAWLPQLKFKVRGFDVVHLHYPFYGTAEWVACSGEPYVVTYHMDASPKKHLQAIRIIYDNLFAKSILKKARRVILVDQNANFKLKSKLASEKISIIPNGIDSEIFHPQPPNFSDFAADHLKSKRILLFVGNLMPVKGLGTLLQALQEISNPDVHLIVVGGGYNEWQYRNKAETLGVSHQITWLGHCSDREKLAKYYALADAVVVPSLSESFSLVAGEALACGKPVIASDIPGIRERVIEGETGFLFEKGSHTDLARTIKKFLKLPLKAKSLLGQNGRELVERKFSLKKHVDELERIYVESRI